MKNRKTEPDLPKIDPDHPNYDAILLKRARLIQHRKRREENRGVPVASSRSAAGAKASTSKPRQKRKPRQGG